MLVLQTYIPLHPSFYPYISPTKKPIKMLKNFHSETLPSVNVLDGTTPVKHVGTCALALQRAGAAGWSWMVRNQWIYSCNNCNRLLVGSFNPSEKYEFVS
jgi:hypothetical protein